MARKSVALQHVIDTVQNYFTALDGISRDQDDQRRYDVRVALQTRTTGLLTATDVAGAVQECRAAGYSPKDFRDAFDDLWAVMLGHSLKLTPMPCPTAEESQWLRDCEAACAWFGEAHPDPSLIQSHLSRPDERARIRSKAVEHSKYIHRQAGAWEETFKALVHIIRMRDDFNAGTPVAAQAGDEPKPDGPEGDCWLWWDNHRYDVPAGVLHRLLKHFWVHEATDYDRLMEDIVWENPVEAQTVRSESSDLNGVLRKISSKAKKPFPWKLTCNSKARLLKKVPAEQAKPRRAKITKPKKGKRK